MTRGGGVRPPPVCADCSAPDPTWASVNRGVLICEECCSVHRSLGRHISMVKSLKKGQWSPSQHAMVYLLATNGANNIWEHTMLDPSQNRHGRKKPGPRDPLHPNKSDFIRAKYQFLSFVNKQKDSDASSLDDVSKELHSSVRTNNAETCLRLLSKGADPNYFYKEKGNCPMHVAAQAGQTAQIELLAVYGADPGIKDANGRTPVDYAKAEGFTDLGDRLVELQYELTDRLTFYICGRKPDHRSGQHFKIPQLGDHTADLSDLAKQAKKKLQDLPNHLLEELAMDVYDEVDRRENDSIWLSTHDHTSIVSERLTVPHLPVNPELSTTRNQGRQKLARFNAREFATLIVDLLNEARIRQTGAVQTPKEPDKLTGMKLLKRPESKTMSAISDEEPLYDNVASDEDYSSIDSQSIRSMQTEIKGDITAEGVLSSERSTTPTSVISFAESISRDGEGPLTTDEFISVRRALVESQAKIQELVQVKSDLEKYLSEMHNKMKSLMMENKTLRVHRESMLEDSEGVEGEGSETRTEVSPARQNPVQTRATSMIEMRGSKRNTTRMSPISSGQLSGASSVSNIPLAVSEKEAPPADPVEQKTSNATNSVYEPPAASAPQTTSQSQAPPPQNYDSPSVQVLQAYSTQGALVPQGYNASVSGLPQRFSSPAGGGVQSFPPQNAVVPQGFFMQGTGLPQGYLPGSMVAQNYNTPGVGMSPIYSAHGTGVNHVFNTPGAGVPQVYNPTQVYNQQNPGVQMFNHPGAGVMQGYNLPGAGAPQGYNAHSSGVHPGYNTPQPAVLQGFNPMGAGVPAMYNPPSAGMGYSMPGTGVRQGFSSPGTGVFQGYSSPSPGVPQGFNTVHNPVPQGFPTLHASAAGSRTSSISNSGALQEYNMGAATPQGYGIPGAGVPRHTDTPSTGIPSGCSTPLIPQGPGGQRVLPSPAYNIPGTSRPQSTNAPQSMPQSTGVLQSTSVSQGCCALVALPPQSLSTSPANALQGRDMPGQVSSLGYNNPKLSISQGQDTSSVTSSQSLSRPSMSIAQELDSPNVIVSQGFRPPVAVAQTRDASSMTPEGYIKPVAKRPQVHELPSLVIAESFRKPNTSIASGTDIQNRVVSQGYKSGINIPQGHDLPALSISEGYPKLGASITQGHDLPALSISEGYPRLSASITQGQDLPVLSISEGLSKPVISANQGLDMPGRTVPQSYKPSVTLPQSLDMSALLSHGNQPVEEMVTQGFSTPNTISSEGRDTPNSVLLQDLTSAPFQQQDPPELLCVQEDMLSSMLPPDQSMSSSILSQSFDTSTTLVAPGYSMTPAAFSQDVEVSDDGGQELEGMGLLPSQGHEVMSVTGLQDLDVTLAGVQSHDSPVFSEGQDAPHSLPSDILSMVPMPTPSMLSASVPECHDLMSGVFRQGHDTLNMLFPEGHDANNSAFLQGFVGELQIHEDSPPLCETSDGETQDSPPSQGSARKEKEERRGEEEEGGEMGTEGVEMPTQEEVVRKTERITRKIQELLQSAQEGNHSSFAPCSDRIHVAVLDMAALFSNSCPTGKVQETLDQLTSSAERLREECKERSSASDQDPPPDIRLKTHHVIQFAFDIAKAAKKLVTLFQ